jgi:hypothetical protein
MYPFAALTNLITKILINQSFNYYFHTDQANARANLD